MRTSNQRTYRRMVSTGWKPRVVGGVGVALLLLFTSCAFRMYESLREHAPPPWRGESVTVDLSRKFPLHVLEMEFAAQNAPYLGFWSLPRSAKEGSYEFGFAHQIKTDAPGRYVVIDFQGNIVTEAVTATGALRDRYVDLFPTLAARQRSAEFIRGAEFWAFSPDGTYGMKSDGTCYRDQKGTQVSCYSLESTYLNVEFWNLTRNELLWEKFLKGYAIRLAHILSWKGQAAVLIALKHEAYLVSQSTGETLGTFPYTIPQDSNSAYQQRFGERFVGGSLFFFSWDIAYNATTRWLLCGASETRRVRIFSVDPPYQLIREVYADQPPYRGWEVRDIRVNGNGRYVILDTAYYGDPWRGPTEVYDVETWARVWSENQQDIEHVTISPDGKKIAFLRGTMLEMGDFHPAKAE